MKFITNLLVGLLLTGVLALAPANSFARGGGGGGGHLGEAAATWERFKADLAATETGR
jgi:hypothetical protein